MQLLQRPFRLRGHSRESVPCRASRRVHCAATLSAQLVLILVAAGLSTAQAMPPSKQGLPLDVTSLRVPANVALGEVGLAAGSPLSIGEPALARWPMILLLRQASPTDAADWVQRFFKPAAGECRWVDDDRGGRSLRDDAKARAWRKRASTTAEAKRDGELISKVETLFRLARMGEAGLERERRRNPDLVYSVPLVRPVLPILASISPVQRKQLLSGSAVITEVGQLPPPLQEPVRTLVSGLRRRQISVPKELGGGFMEWRADRDLPTTPLVLRLAGRPDRPGLAMVLVIMHYTRQAVP